MSEHTKEPWHTGKNHNAERFIYGEDGWAIAECVQTKDKMFANASRIVACVNACAGMDDPKIEIEKYRLRAENAEYLSGAKYTGIDTVFGMELKEILQLRHQCNIFLFALQEISKITYDEWTNGTVAKDIALSAISKADGE